MSEEFLKQYQQLLQQVEKRDSELSAAKREIERKDQIIAGLQQRLFGKKSERYDPDQQQLDFGEDVLGKPETPSSKKPDEDGASDNGEPSPRTSRRSKRELLPRNLPVHIVAVSIPEEVQNHPDDYQEIGEEHHDELAVQKPALYWKRTIRKKYKSRLDRHQAPLICAAPLPSVPGTLCDPSLLAMILTDKYLYHDPHYRQSTRYLNRFGAELSRQTLNTWTHAAATHLTPIYDALRQEMRTAEILQVDETPMHYLLPGSGKVQQGYQWWYRDAKAQTIYCDWQLGRGHECLVELLGLDGTGAPQQTKLIQCDGYSAYVALKNRYKNIQLGACLAHIRRKFFEATQQAPRIVDEILSRIRHLYKIESQLPVGPEMETCRRMIRRTRSRPLLNELKEKIVEQRGKHLPKTKLGEALTYALGQWEQLERYLDHDALNIDNNVVENLIRPSKLGMKNYLFIGRAEAGKNSALLYTLVANCRVQGIDPETYFEEALRRIQDGASVEDGAELTPAKLAEIVRAKQPNQKWRNRERQAAATKAA